MIAALKRVAKAHWPALSLRSILFATLFVTAALPGVGALFLRVYENTLVRQTEAELVAQGAALAATAASVWGERNGVDAAARFRPEPSTIDLRVTPVLDERPPASPASALPDARAQLAAGTLAPIFARTQRTTLAAITLVDARGTVVLGHEAGGSYAAVPEITAALGGRVATMLRRNAAYRQRYAFEWLSRASSLRIHHARPVVVGGRVVGVVLLSRSPRALFRGLYEDRGKILFGIASIFAVLVLLSGLLSRGIARPIAILGQATRSLAKGEVVVPEAPVTAAIEIRALYENFRTMAAAIEFRSHYLRDFAAAVSHEFKTPLAGIRGAVELLQDHGATMADDERARFLGNIAADAGRLAQLVTRLLDLARADLMRADAETWCDPVSTARAVADAFDCANFRVRLDGVEGALIAIAPAALTAVLTTLVENARQAGASEVRIAVATSATAIVTVSDNGPGIAAGDRERIFEAFFTTRRASGGTGLGLAIARSLLGGSGATLELVDSPAGAAFVISAAVPEAIAPGA